MKASQSVLQHFAREERDFVEKMMDLCQQVEDTYSYRLTPFLHPRQDEIVKTLANYYKLQYFSSREILETEHSRGILAPSYYVLDPEDFDMVALDLSYPRKFHSLSHSQVLGTFLHQLGIKREYLGDIHMGDESVIVLLDRKFGDLALQSISKIARVPVKGRERDWTKLDLVATEEAKTKDVLVSSLRLDKVIAVAYHLSRSVASKLIESGQVKLDYVEVLQPGKQLEIGQLISVRRYGRIRLKENLGFSKQGKVKLTLDIIKT